ncbi:MAG: hypothetical protein ACTS6J_12970 [Burkholderiales bacterium]
MVCGVTSRARRPPRRKVKLRRAEWSRALEDATLRSDAAGFDAARAAFKAAAPALQMRLAREIAETRARELCIAYKNVVMVAAGYKTTRGGRRVSATPCVTFVVRRKWQSRKGRPGDLQRLPKHLLTYTGIDEKRVLCAVPTDVVPEQIFFGAATEAPAGIMVGSVREVGNATCAVSLRVGNRRTLMMLCCQHVLSPDILPSHPEPEKDHVVALLDLPAERIGVTSRFGGQIRYDDNYSFDVQLSDVSNREAFAAALDGIRLAPGREYITAQGFDALGAGTRFSIVVSPRNGGPPNRAPIPAVFRQHLPSAQPLPYKFMVGSVQKEYFIRQRHLLAFAPQIRTRKGDSGSPVVIPAPGGGFTLVGMHVGSNDNFTFALPAWLLFDPYQYSVLPSGASVEPIAV